MHRSFVLLLAGLSALAVTPSHIFAQAVRLGVAGGFAIPTGAYGQTRTAGPLVRGTLTLGGPERRVRFRGDLEGAWLLDIADGASVGVVSSRQGTLRAVSALASVLVGPAGGHFTPYLIAGAGAQRLSVEKVRNPYGTVAGVRAGVGIRFRLGRTAVHAEITPHWALTDFGTGRDFEVGSYVPMVVGVSF